MKKILIITFLMLLSLQISAFAEKRTITTYSRIPNNNYYNRYNAYNNDLIGVEEYLFGQNFAGDAFLSRLNRIERRIFNNNYSAMNPVDRVNNILLNYRTDSYMSNNYKKSTAQKIIDRFIGQPTGFTPPIMNTPYNDYGYPVGINRYNYSNRGYRYHNVLPATAGAGIHILD